MMRTLNPSSLKPASFAAHTHRHRPPIPPIKQPVASLSTSSLTLQRKPGCACGGTCPRCQAEKALQTQLQTKLKISAPGDVYEQEADRVANQVMQISAPSAVSSSASELPLQRQTANSNSPSMPGALSSLQGSGQPLSETTRTFFEPRFGTDLSQVRIHTTPKAQDMASAVQARAFTVGQNIVFGAGQYHPSTAAGQQLLAHELTHVLQQTGGTFSNESELQRQVLPVSQRFPYGGLQRQADSPTGGNPCLDQCEKDFQRCLDHTTFPPECIARRSACMRGCPETTPPSSGFP